MHDASPSQTWLPVKGAQGAGLCVATQRLVHALVLFGLLVAAPVWASGGDHERAREAVSSGQILPLARVLERLAREHPGQVLELELEREDGAWVYEVKLLQPDGRLLKLHLDARTGAAWPRR